ncbi:hypothetical protein JX265_002704 [Neoarthrinium moseri]|uniref:Azaphilone pigments biosynthesis cluster protein L N-terminal domain-containing protein n=1 Tax=Neoarthrinium moseri TaxID=1658444 RepID=A0A9P9WUX9_9PEZI|nr:hypothetical protein JX265_002704 [Neoarthrinium moseri]
MDPLSVVASVAGLLGVGAKITSVLFSMITGCREAPSLARHLLWELADISTALGHLQRYIIEPSKVAADRTSMIQLDHVLTSLTGCVTTYSDLQQILDGLNTSPDMRAYDRLRWARKESTLNTIVSRLQNHRASLSLILAIIQCESAKEAEAANEKLVALVQETLRNQHELAERIQGLEREGSIFSVMPKQEDEVGDNASTRTARARKIFPFIDSATEALRSAFQQDLERSRVYMRTVKKAVNRNSQFSLRSSQETTAESWSRLSLSQVSSLSVCALPIYAGDIVNSDSYDFGDQGPRATKSMAKKASGSRGRTSKSSRYKDGPSHYKSPTDQLHGASTIYLVQYGL